MAQEFVPTDPADVALLNNWNGQVIAVSLPLPSGATLPAPPIGCVWKIQDGKCVAQKGEVQGLMG